MNPIKFTPVSHPKWKSMMITDEVLILSSKRFRSLKSMTENIERAGEEERVEFWYKNLEEINYLSKGSNLTLKQFDANKNLESVTISVDRLAVLNKLIKVISKKELFNSSEERINILSIGKVSITRILITIGGTSLLFLLAKSIENGSQTGGSYSILKVIVFGLLSIIGKIGVLIIGTILSLFFIYQLVQKLKNPPTLIKMKRVKK